MKGKSILAILLVMECFFAVHSEMRVLHHWNTIQMEGYIKYKVNQDKNDGWKIKVTFSEPIFNFKVRGAIYRGISDDGKGVTIKNPRNELVTPAGTIILLPFSASSNFTSPPQGAVFMFNDDATTTSTTTASTSTSTTTTTSSSTATATTTSSPTTSTSPTTTSSPSSSSTTSSPISSTTTHVPNDDNVFVIDYWALGGGTRFNGKFTYRFKDDVNYGWLLVLTFTKPVSDFDIYRADLVDISDDGLKVFIKNKSYNGMQTGGTLIEMSFQASTTGSEPPSATVHMPGEAVPSTPTTTESGSSTTTTTTTASSPTTPSTTSGSTSTSGTTSSSGPSSTSTTNMPTTTTLGTDEYNYKEALHKSILFYEAQRSGDLPDTNRIPWRGDSALNDRGNDGEDLTGGWYDAGDFVKFGFPMAASVTTLAWGLIEFENAYNASGELEYMRDSIKWPLDYFMKAHVKDNEFYGQVADAYVDHSYWGRPEDMTMNRPAWKIDQSAPGSDLAGETAAALAAGYIALRNSDRAYADKLLEHAKTLYNFAYTYRGKYSDSIANARDFYSSSNFVDELAWGATWLYFATGEQHYLEKAKEFYSSGTPWALSWDDKVAGTQLLLAILTGNDNYKNDAERFLESWFPGGSVPYTPKGLAWRSKWGANRYSANTAFLATIAAKYNIKKSESENFAKGQINYMLGDTGRSFVVGFGVNPPTRPHHTAASCPSTPNSCGWDYLHTSAPNPHVLNGALVGGPGQNDEYQDVRNDYIRNEVACDYNAGFQGALAGLIARNL